jgi:hypothetical protein
MFLAAIFELVEGRDEEEMMDEQKRDDVSALALEGSAATIDAGLYWREQNLCPS